MSNILNTIVADRATARLQSPKETYPILTRIVGDYELVATGKNPQQGDAVVIAIINGLIKANNDTIELLKKTQGGEKEHAAEILRLENQTRLIGKYVPEVVEEEPADNPDLISEEEYLEILVEGGFEKLGDYHKYLKANYDGRYEGAVATRIFNSVQKG